MNIKPKKPKTILLVVFLIVQMFLPVQIFLNPPRIEIQEAEAYGNGWLDGWVYRTPIEIDGNVEDLIDYQVQVTLQGTNSSAANYVDFDKGLTGGADIRFTDDDKITEIDFWIEEWVDTSGSESATVWVEVPSVLTAGIKTVYVYYGKSGESSGSDGNETFEFFDDFENPEQGYFELNDAQNIMVQDQGWETSAPHTMDVLELDMGGYKYWGYYGLQEGDNAPVGLARSNDLITWDKYGSNPINITGRWPQVLKVGDTIYMTYAKYSGGDIKTILASSPATDGINFTDVEDITTYETEGTNPNGCFYYNPNDNKYYFYWHNTVAIDDYRLRVKVADSPLDLDEASIITVLTSDDILAAPDIFYHNGIYYLTYEILKSGVWHTDYYTSILPTSGFVYKGNILRDGGACWFHQEFDGILYGYFCQSTSGVWTLDLRTSNMDDIEEILNFNNKWGDSGVSSSEIITDTEQNGGTGKVLKATFPASTQVLYSKNYTASDYIVETYVKFITAGVSGTVVSRYSDLSNRYTTALYEAIDVGNNLLLYTTKDGSSVLSGQAALGTLDTDIWYKTTSKVSGSNLKIYFNDELKIETTNSDLSEGMVGVRGGQSGEVRFNNFLTRKYTSTEPTPTTTSAFRGYDKIFTGITNTISATDYVSYSVEPIVGNSIDMTITPASGSIDTSITIWNTSSPYYKKWTETGSGDIDTVHTVGDLETNKYYTVWYTKDGGTKTRLTTQQAASSQISFTYDQGYSDVEFEIEEDTTAPTLSETTPVPTPTSDLTPDYIFNTDEAGAILYGGSCLGFSTTTATSGSNTVSFNALTNGIYADCTVTITDTAGNISDALSITSFTIASAGITITESSSSTDIEEGSTTDTYTIVLDTTPTNNVVLTITPDTQSTIDSSILTFTSSDWDAAQTIIITATDDTNIESDHTSTIIHTSASDDSNYDGLSISSITANITDNDFAGGGFIPPAPPVISLSPNQSFEMTIVENQATINLSNIENAYQIAISTTPDFKYVSWEPYQESIALPDAEKVWIKFRSSAGGVSEVYEIETNTNSTDSNTNNTNLSNGSLIKAINDFKVYVINGNNYIRHIIDEIIFDFYGHLNKEDIQEVDSSLMDNYQESYLIREVNDYRVYEIKGGKKYWLDISAEEFVERGYSWDEVYVVNEGELGWYERQ